MKDDLKNNKDEQTMEQVPGNSDSKGNAKKSIGTKKGLKKKNLEIEIPGDNYEDEHRNGKRKISSKSNQNLTDNQPLSSNKSKKKQRKAVPLFGSIA